ncbi:UNVERIFIED_CONTAM: hypothetical protein HDU68_002622 [Siphonaria sp. JEL0065]|nr:hypothetical protein HDU68_002622 [Siphonaria sp. JEL0065]
MDNQTTKRKHEADEGSHASITAQSPAQKRALVHSESPAASPMKGVEGAETFAKRDDSSSRRNLMNAFLKVSGKPGEWDEEAEKPAALSTTKTASTPSKPPIVPAFGSSSSFGSSAFGSSFASTTAASFGSLASNASKDGKDNSKPKTVENEKNPFGSVAFGDAGRSKFQFGNGAFGVSSPLALSAFASASTFPTAPAATSVFGAKSSFVGFGTGATINNKNTKKKDADEDGSVSPLNTKEAAAIDTESPQKSTRPITPIASLNPVSIPDALCPISPSTAASPAAVLSGDSKPVPVVVFGGTLGGRDSEVISYGKDSLSANSTVKAVSFNASEPAFGSKASVTSLSFGNFASSASSSSTKPASFGSFASTATTTPTSTSAPKDATSLTASSIPTKTPTASDNAFETLLKSTPALKQSSKEKDDDNEEGESDDENPTEQEVAIEKKVDIPEIEVKTGEEDESNIIQLRCKLYRMDATNTWKERGVGNLRLNCVEDDRSNRPSARLVMRAEGVLRLILNARVLEGMPVQIVQEKFIQFACCEDGTPGLTRFLVKTANENAALKLYNHIRVFSEKDCGATA